MLALPLGPKPSGSLAACALARSLIIPLDWQKGTPNSGTSDAEPIWILSRARVRSNKKTIDFVGRARNCCACK